MRLVFLCVTGLTCVIAIALGIIAIARPVRIVEWARTRGGGLSADLIEGLLSPAERVRGLGIASLGLGLGAGSMFTIILLSTT